MAQVRPHPRALTAEDHAHPHPIFAVWELTLACDQACRHCGSRAGAARASELSRDEAIEVVAVLAGLGVREVALLGGEVYLRPDWLDIVRAVAAAGMRCTLVSGGRALSDERVRAAAAAGLWSISVSVDGLPASHDALRGVPGSWGTAMAALARISGSGMVPAVNTQINRLNLAELEEVADGIVGRGARAWQLQLTNPMGRAADLESLVLQPWMLDRLMPRLATLAARLERRGCTLAAANNLGYFGPHEGDLRLGGHWIGCPGGRFSLGIQSDGRLKACASLPTRPWAGADARSLAATSDLAAHPTLVAVAARGVDDLWGFCRTCYYARLCKGGCVWTAQTYLGRPGNNPFCHHRVLELKARGLRERLEQTTPAPGEPFDQAGWRLVEEPWVEEDP
jgi:radical SAM protein with 4Fe4S-binding SPASM domain